MVEVGHTCVHGVLERHLLPLQVGGGWGLEEMEKEHLVVSYCVCCKCCRHWSKTRFGFKDCRRGRGGAGWGRGLSVGWGQESKGEGRSRVGTGPKCGVGAGE